MASEFKITKTYRVNHSTPMRYVISHMIRHPLLIVMLFIGAFSNGALAAVVPRFIGRAFDAMIDPGVYISLMGLESKFQSVIRPTDYGLKIVGAMALAIVASQALRGVLQLMRNMSAETFGQRIERDVRDELYSSLLGKSMKFHDLMPVGEIMARATNDVRELNFMMNPGVNLIVGSSMFLIMPLVAAPFIYPDLVILPAIFIVLHLGVQYHFIRMVHPVAEDVRFSFGRMNSRLAESLDGLQVVKGSAQERAESARFDSLADEVRNHFVSQGKIEARYLSNLLFGLVVVLGFIHSIILYNQGAIKVGDIVAFTSLLSLFGFPVFTSLFSLSRLALGLASAGRILSVINTVTDLDRNPAGYNEKIKGKLTFDKVFFGYAEDDERQILHDISFTVEQGQTIALVGQTGSGKSTVTKLINRIYDASSGRILIDDVDVREWDLESLRSQVSIIEQDIFLFSRTIAENIAFGDQSATQEQIEEAAKNAQAHEFIMGFPEGYDTVIGQRGVTLSGGQRQRLALARAFLTDPPILILDDSTSAIDSATEDKIQRAIWAATRGRTTILITHRLSQIRWADHIVVLKRGAVVAQGNHEALLESSEAYRRIFARYES